MAQCKAKTKSGKPCKMRVLKGSSYCFNHAPAAAAQRAAARKRGGEARHNPSAGDPGAIPAQINSVQDARRILDFVKDELLVLDNTIARNRALIALHDSIAKSIEIGELEERIAALEARLNAKS
jgi:hypothetical protein